MLDFPSANTSTPLLEATELEHLLGHLKQASQIDLTGYKRSSLLRRTQMRMQRIGVKNYQNYLDHLQQQPDEVQHLLDTILINYTYFFRDPFVWNYLANHLIPQIVANKAPDQLIRVWSAGCASGEETYSLAMMLIEILGVEQFQQRVRIWGTDADPDAILQARQGYYLDHGIEAVPEVLREKYFERRGDRHYWRSDFRRSITFQLHNLIQEPPLPNIDLLVCRNTLMYFTPETQLRTLIRFHFGLEQSGYLLLGQSENLVTCSHAALFTSIDKQVNVFTKVLDAHRDRRLLPLAFTPLSL
ncbi:MULTISPECIES: protein-glutamate O-methyltransferase CheR [unclassified Leptolyngbya]|uniref:CheR family methyltransferase n=1 Tax=unclassified Leptolyngbya TaxID=2650499 RepID=UPI0016835B40|nr:MULTISPECIES: protein-glutamate O-methyltransferase CheR [unclassified Leptolyngbya]MBD1909161.1 protein-glutamate O-methyltransferase CheR [Leptolyngbya sp. FACHB-8]MBD2158459.1 protein-glutamate O-methyltransferase CheR [Leptolyngbya sp. FACHB-16]